MERWPGALRRHLPTMVPADPLQSDQVFAQPRQAGRCARVCIGLAAIAAAVAGLVLLVAALGLTTSLRTRNTLAVEAIVPLRVQATQALPQRPQRRVVVRLRNSAEAVAAYFGKLDYRLPRVRTGVDVPRVYVPELPRDLGNLQPTERRKSLFVRIVLPLVLQENERLAHERARLLSLGRRQRAGEPLSVRQRAWLNDLYAAYGVPPGQRTALLRRVDVVPPSLALAQAATESAWGTSRFVRNGNALFGMWTWTDDTPGMVPLEREEGARYRVRGFASLQDSVRAYMHTLNTHWAYVAFRTRRAALRKAGAHLDGLTLAGDVSLYSQQRQVYTLKLRRMIRVNGFAALDHTSLGNDWARATAALPRAASLANTALIAQDSGR